MRVLNFHNNSGFSLNKINLMSFLIPDILECLIAGCYKINEYI